MKNNKKEIIFYYPSIKRGGNNSGEAIRPFKMISAFQDIGYDVHLVSGNSSDRKRKIYNLKEKISKYFLKPAFAYIESSNLPLPMATPGQKIPNFFLDINFLHWLKRHGVKLGLFYRDIYWKFDSWWKRQGLLRGLLIWPLYYYELYRYLNVVDIVFCPSIEFRDVIYNTKRNMKYAILPPGCDLNIDKPLPAFNNTLNLFYVGGCKPPIYDLTVVLQACQALGHKVSLTICTREQEWYNVKYFYKDYINSNVRVVHESGKDVKKRYISSHIFILPINNNNYRAIMMPIKLFEAIDFCRPIIAFSNSAAGRFVKENGIGWAVNNNSYDLTKAIEKILKENSLIIKAAENINKIRIKQSWKERAISVVETIDGLSHQ